jgi:hypothetical protein
MGYQIVQAGKWPIPEQSTVDKHEIQNIKRLLDSIANEANVDETLHLARVDYELIEVILKLLNSDRAILENLLNIIPNKDHIKKIVRSINDLAEFSMSGLLWSNTLSSTTTINSTSWTKLPDLDVTVVSPVHASMIIDGTFHINKTSHTSTFNQLLIRLTVDGTEKSRIAANYPLVDFISMVSLKSTVIQIDPKKEYSIEFSASTSGGTGSWDIRHRQIGGAEKSTTTRIQTIPGVI